jgi:hypothetical protein
MIKRAMGMSHPPGHARIRLVTGWQNSTMVVCFALTSAEMVMMIMMSAYHSVVNVSQEDTKKQGRIALTVQVSPERATEGYTVVEVAEVRSCPVIVLLEEHHDGRTGSLVATWALHTDGRPALLAGRLALLAAADGEPRRGHDRLVRRRGAVAIVLCRGAEMNSGRVNLLAWVGNV